jgi:hypothetical protein
VRTWSETVNLRRRGPVAVGAAACIRRDYFQ